MSVKDAIYKDLKEQIVFCELLPGSLISEEDLCKQYEVSRTPVREVLLQLKREEYITVESRKSTKVSKINFQEMNEIIEVRLMIEPGIIRSLNAPLPAEMCEALEEMRQRFAALGEMKGDSVRNYLQADFAFHSLLASLSNNHIMTDFYCSILERSIRHWYLMYVRMEGRLKQAQNEHEVIIRLLEDGNYPSAAKELEKHIRAYYDLNYYN